MRFEITGRHLTITPAMRRAVQDRLSHLERLLTRAAVSAQVVVTREKTRLRVEVNLHAKGEHFLHAEATGRDWQAALASAAAKIESQAHTLKGKWSAGKRRGVAAGKAESATSRVRRDGVDLGASSPAEIGDERAVRIIRARRYPLKPMSIEEAGMEMIDRRNAFLVFRNASNDAVSVLYRRPDGNLGLIEPDA